MVRINKPIARVALDHTFLFLLNCGLLMTAWATFLFKSFVVGLFCGVGTALVGFVLWMPRYGPLRNYVEGHIADE
jgi:hypothetical protein